MSFLSDIFGSTPKVPDFEKLDLAEEQKKSVAGNLENLPKVENLVSKANLFSIDQINKMLENVGAGSLFREGSDQIGKMVRGELPLSDIQQQELRSVAKSFGGGFAGSPAGGNLVARDLGLRQLEVIGKGLSSAESWMRSAAALYEPSMVNLASMFISPMQQAAFDVSERNAQFNRDWMQQQVNALPDPVLSGINAQITEFGKAFLGGGGGGLSGGWGFSGGGVPVSSGMQYSNTSWETSPVRKGFGGVTQGPNEGTGE